MTVPYQHATSGAKARDEINRILRRFGCDQIGWMDDSTQHEVLLAFTHRGRAVQLKASAAGWAQMFLREQPFNYRRRQTRQDYEQAALRQGHVAVSSILRDWLKGQIMAVECGILSFEAIFLAHMLTADGRPLIERVKDENLLPAPQEEKVVSIGGGRRQGAAE